MEKHYIEEIAYEKKLYQKAIKGEKITSDERKWLLTHSSYNMEYGIIAYKTAIEQLETNTLYSIKIKVESISYKDRICPTIAVPVKSGWLFTDFDVYNYDGKLNPSRKVRMLCVDFNESSEFIVDYRSSSGLLAVTYECDYYDEKMKLHKREASDGANLGFAMRKEIIDDNSVRYFCKSPLKDSFDALVFTIEWKKKE